MGFDLGKIFKQLFYAMLDLVRGVGALWDWLTDSHTIFTGLKFTIFEWEIVLVPSFEFTPIMVIGAVGIIAIIVLWIIKGLVPLMG